MLGNQRPPQAINALETGLDDAEPLVREACAWALGQFGDERAERILSSHLASEPDATVQTALRQALRRIIV